LDLGSIYPNRRRDNFGFDLIATILAREGILLTDVNVVKDPQQVN